MIGEPVDDDLLYENANDEYAIGVENIFERNGGHSEEENNDEESENEDNMEEDPEPLYHNADITVKESMLLILSLMLRHNLAMTTISDIISVKELHCPEMGLKKK